MQKKEHRKNEISGRKKKKEQLLKHRELPAALEKKPGSMVKLVIHIFSSYL